MPADTLEEMIADGQRAEAERQAEIRRQYDIGGSRPRFRTVPGGKADEQAAEPFGLRPVRILDQTAIPHRRWIYGTQLIRGFVTLLIAPGGTGKSSLLLATCLSIATGRPLLGPRIYQPCNTALLNLEDPQ